MTKQKMIKALLAKFPDGGLMYRTLCVIYSTRESHCNNKENT